MNQDMYHSKCPACQRTLECCNCDIGIVPERVLNFNWGQGNGSTQTLTNPNRSGTKRSRTCPDFAPMDCSMTDSSGDTKRRILQHAQSFGQMAPTPQQQQQQQQQIQFQMQMQQQQLQQIPNLNSQQQQQHPNATQQNPYMQNFNAKIPDTGFLFKH